MKISAIHITDDIVQITTERNGEPLVLVYSGEVAHQLRVERDGSLTVDVSVTPNPQSRDKMARHTNRTFLDR